jgi:hypothetical protein
MTRRVLWRHQSILVCDSIAQTHTRFQWWRNDIRGNQVNVVDWNGQVHLDLIPGRTSKHLTLQMND